LSAKILLGAFGALATGLAIGVQSTITSRVGSMIGDIRTGLLTNFLGGIIAGALVGLVVLREGPTTWNIPKTALALVALSGLLGIFIITGISFSLQRAGVAAGLATVILGQMIVSIIVDSRGIGGVEPIPLTAQRVVGVLVLGLAVYLLLPRQ
jgi:transporter family-2 protein